MDIIQPELEDAGDKQLKFIIFNYFCKSQLKYIFDLSLIPKQYQNAESKTDVAMIEYFAYLNESDSYEHVIHYIKTLREKYIEDYEVIYIMILREEIKKYCTALSNFNSWIEFENIRYNSKSKKSLKRIINRTNNEQCSETAHTEDLSDY